MSIAAFPAAAPLTLRPLRPSVPVRVPEGPSPLDRPSPRRRPTAAALSSGTTSAAFTPAAFAPAPYSPAPYSPAAFAPTPVAPALPAPRGGTAPRRGPWGGTAPRRGPWTPGPAGRRPGAVVPGRFLVAAVAVGAVLPAAQTLGAHVPEADLHTATLQGAQLALAAQQGGAGAAVTAAATALDGVTTVSLSDADLAGGASSTATAALTKAASVAREAGTPKFGTPYVAGNEKTLDGQIAKALGLLGLPQKLAPGVKQIVMRESTGKADAVNNWDSNAAAGTPSKGLMQLIDPTFRTAVLPSLAGKGIYDPVANITAGIRTMIANHGIDAVMDGGLRNSAGNYIGYGGGKLPTDGLGIASRS